MYDINTLYLRNLSQEKCEQLAKFLEEGFPTDSYQKWMLRFNLWWFSNPAMDEDTPIGWEVTNNNQVLGFRGNIPVFYTLGSQKIKGSASTSWYMRAEIRKEYSELIFNEQLKQKNVNLFIATTPIPPVQKRLLNAGFKAVESNRETTSYHIVTNWNLEMRVLTHHFLKTAKYAKGIQKRKYSSLSNICSTIGKILSILKQDNKIPYNSQQIGDYLFDELVDVNKFVRYGTIHANHNLIEISNDIENIGWMFFSDAVKTLLSRTVSLVFDNSENYIGYFVYDIKEQHSIKSLYVRDIKLLDYNLNVLKSISKYVRNIAKINSCSGVYISVLTRDEKLYHQLNKLILIKKKRARKSFILLNTRNNNSESYNLFNPSDLDPDRGLV